MTEYNSCHLCPRECGANRTAGDTGFCGVDAQCRIAAILPHFGEEPCLTGQNGSGTVFFTGCSCGCFFCQNHQISHGAIGKVYDENSLVAALREIIAKGVHNLNFVTPDHFWPHIRQACMQIRKEGFDLPFLWNCSGYAKAELVREQSKIIDVFLPDFKFSLPELAKTCMGDSRYPELALKAIETMVDSTGFLRPWAPKGDITATRGTLVRHLVLPGQLENSLKALDILHTHFGPLLPISIMSQFQPMPECAKSGIFNTKLEPDIYQKVCQHAEELGFTRVFKQLDGGDDNFAPDFTADNPFGKTNKPQQ